MSQGPSLVYFKYIVFLISNVYKSENSWRYIVPGKQRGTILVCHSCFEDLSGATTIAPRRIAHPDNVLERS